MTEKRGRKPLPESRKKVKLTATISPAARAYLEKMADDNDMASVSEALERVILDRIVADERAALRAAKRAAKAAAAEQAEGKETE